MPLPFPSVSRLRSTPLILVIAVELDYEIYMTDVRRNFSTPMLDKEVFVKMHPGFERSDTDGVPLMIELKKHRYGFHQSSITWFGTTDQCSGAVEFRPLKSAPCVYISEDKVGFGSLTLYVDGLFLLKANKLLLNKPKKQLIDRFERTKMDDISIGLGMNVARERAKGMINI